MAMGVARERTILVEIGPMRGASDLAGIHTVRLNNAVASRDALRKRLLDAGCAIDERRRRWRNPRTGGDFAGVLAG